VQPIAEGAVSRNGTESMSLILQWFQKGSLGATHNLLATY
jgi:hypothetical protein